MIRTYPCPCGAIVEVGAAPVSRDVAALYATARHSLPGVPPMPATDDDARAILRARGVEPPPITPTGTLAPHGAGTSTCPASGHAPPLTLATHLDAAAWARIRSALTLAHGNQTAAALALGLHRNRLRDAIARLDLTAEAAAYARATRQPRGR